ncbi:MAG: hypothetical protein EKK47_07985 [Burkholderiales bacterium]|jgi:outer membrane scaffolding protein for murein synthesis (MipA/OmpV family)|nr:MAG: hypothetical protein EKK47_07985 [Burkholderiales bacterium]
MKRSIARCLLVCLAIWRPECALAWGTLLLIEAPPKQDTLAIGGTMWSMPRAPDGAHQTALLTPAIEYDRHDGWFASTEMGLGFNASSSERWQAGLRLWPQFGRDRQDASASQPRLGPRLQKQLFANGMLGDIALLQSAVSYGSGQSQNGVQTELGLTSGLPLARGFVGVGLAATYGNRTYRRDYTGIDRAGWSDWSWTVNVDHRVTAVWHVDAQYQQASVSVRPASAPPGSAAETRVRPYTALLTVWRDL